MAAFFAISIAFGPFLLINLPICLLLLIPCTLAPNPINPRAPPTTIPNGKPLSESFPDVTTGATAAELPIVVVAPVGCAIDASGLDAAPVGTAALDSVVVVVVEDSVVAEAVDWFVSVALAVGDTDVVTSGDGVTDALGDSDGEMLGDTAGEPSGFVNVPPGTPAPGTPGFAGGVMGIAASASLRV